MLNKYYLEMFGFDIVVVPMVCVGESLHLVSSISV